MTRLPPADWTRREDLAALVAALGADSLRWVGGIVRDTLLGQPAGDVDAATLHRPEAVIERLERAGIRAIPTGIDHGTVTAILPEGTVEVTTLRRDVSTDGRRATVAFATDWREDAARRDFTINALYADPATLEVHDWFGGLADLEARSVRFIGDARERIREDHLRILRYYRFQTRFGGALDDDAEAACAELAPTLKGLSRERVAMELLSLLALPDPSATVARMEQRGVLPVILPEAGAAGVAALDRLVREEALDRLLLAGADVSPLAGWDIPRFPLKGGEIVERGVSAGPEVARILRELEDRWVAERFPGRERVLELLGERLAR